MISSIVFNFKYKYKIFNANIKFQFLLLLFWLFSYSYFCLSNSYSNSILFFSFLNSYYPRAIINKPGKINTNDIHPNPPDYFFIFFFELLS